MHDVGKIAIPDRILLKPGPLTADERAEIERHPIIGAELLTGIGSELLDMAAVIARSHHEWYDGTGYPRRLGGEAIPLAGRIVAVADVFDALTSDRVYRRAFTLGRAVKMMRDERGTHFDPHVLDILLANVAEIVELGTVRASARAAEAISGPVWT
jgi:putative two-component system response regulator